MMKNTLAAESSPYLLQHASDPVHWQRWSEDVFKWAQQEHKLIFLSVGYSTCHWCHVMARESFSDPTVAEILNHHFVNVKVDREERPDIDATYMAYLQLTAGQGGWPMNIWLTPEGKPLVGNTYFPPRDQQGRMGFKNACIQISKLWNEAPERALKSSNKVFLEMQRRADDDAGTNSTPMDQILRAAVSEYQTQFDPQYGGFGLAPKFPRPVALDLLIYQMRKGCARALKMLEKTLSALGQGGIFDHLEGGFHRYSVDEKWHIPHFEKMLYDQGQLIYTYAAAYAAGKSEYKKIIYKTIDYLEHFLKDESGAYVSGEDADSEGVDGIQREGAFWVWSSEQIYSAIGDAKLAALFCHHFGVEHGGNVARSIDPHGELSGENVLYRHEKISETAQLFGVDKKRCEELINQALHRLYQVRQERQRPHRDRKLIAAWNAYCLKGISHAAWVLQDERLVRIALRLAAAIRSQLWDGKVLYRSCLNGVRKIQGFAQDYASIINALTELRRVSSDSVWGKWALQLQDQQDQQFWDEERDAYVLELNVGKQSLFKMVEDYDGAEPSVCALAYENLARLSVCYPDLKFQDKQKKLRHKLMKLVSDHGFSSPAIVRSLHAYENGIKLLKIGENVKQVQMKKLVAESCPTVFIIQVLGTDILHCDSQGCRKIHF